MDDKSTPGCFATLLKEWSPCGDFFSVHDPVTDRIIDIPESFSPLSLLAIAGKFLTGTISLGTMIFCILESEHRYFMFSFLAYWALALQCAYHVLSFSNSIIASSIQQPKFYVDGRVRLTWIIFNTSLVASILAAG